MTSFTVTTQAELNRAVLNASGGDEIVLGSQLRGATLYLKNFTKAGGLTIRSADPGNPGQLASFGIDGCAGITLQNIDCKTRGGSLNISNSRNIVLDSLHLHSDDDVTKAGSGLQLRGCSNVTVSNCEFDHLTAGLSFRSSNNVVFSDNRFHDIVNDAIIGGSTSNLTIQGNSFTDFRHEGWVIHPDCIQLLTVPGDAVSRNIRIDGNIYTRGNGSPVQGIWVKNDTGLAPFENVSITNNTIIGGNAQGIGVTAVGSAVVSGNFVQGIQGQPSNINVTDTRGSVLVQNNVATSYIYNGANAYFIANRLTAPLATAATGALYQAIRGALPGLNLSWGAQGLLGGAGAGLPLLNVLTGARPDGSFVISASAAELLAHPEAAQHMKIQITGSNTVDVTQAAALSSLGQLSLAPGASLVLQGTATDLLNGRNYAVTHLGVLTGMQITGTSTLSVSQANVLAGFAHLTAADGAGVAIVDWASNVAKGLDTLQGLVQRGIVGSIRFTDANPIVRISDTQYANDTDALAAISAPFQQIVVGAADHATTLREAGTLMDASAGNQTVQASAGGNLLIGGNGDTLIGGSGADTFVFKGRFGQETVRNFGTGTGGDVLQFDRSVFSDWAHLLAATRQTGSDLTIALDSQNSVTLANTSLSSLTAANVRFG